MTDIDGSGTKVPGQVRPAPDEPTRRHKFRNDLSSAAAQMEEALQQIRETRALLLDMVRADLSQDGNNFMNDTVAD